MPATVNSNLVSETVIDAEVLESPATPAASPIPTIRPKAPKPQQSLTTITAISFSLTFVGVSIALLTGVLPPDVAALNLPVDMGVVLLMVPLCALVLAMLAEVLRTALRGLPRIRPPRPATILSPRPALAPVDWRAGGREG